MAVRLHKGETETPDSSTVWTVGNFSILSFRGICCAVLASPDGRLFRTTI